MGSTHRALHIPATEPRPAAEAVPKKPGKSAGPRISKSIARDLNIQRTIHPACNALDAVRDAQRESKLISQAFREALTSFNRHGSLIVARGAAKRFIEAVDALIAAEEGS